MSAPCTTTVYAPSTKRSFCARSKQSRRIFAWRARGIPCGTGSGLRASVREVAGAGAGWRRACPVVEIKGHFCLLQRVQRGGKTLTLLAVCRICGAGVNQLGGLGFAAAPTALTLSGGVSTRAVSRRVAAPEQLRAQASGGDDNVVEKYRQILADLDRTPDTGKKQQNFFSKMVNSAKSAVKTCETDYDCNPGGRNWPLRCVNVVFSKICIESDDDFGGGRGIAEVALEAIPVRVEDGYYGNGVGRNNPGQW